VSDESKLNALLAAYEDWSKSHTDDDKMQLLGFAFARSERRTKAIQDNSCASGNHGFNVRTHITPGWICSHCEHCGKAWQTPDRPVCC